MCEELPKGLIRLWFLICGFLTGVCSDSTRPPRRSLECIHFPEEVTGRVKVNQYTDWCQGDQTSNSKAAWHKSNRQSSIDPYTLKEGTSLHWMGKG